MKKLLQSLFILMFVTVTAMAQDRTVTGKVTDKEDGKPLPGVTVKIKGAQGGTQTGGDGKFTLKVPTSATGLEFSYLGYVPQTVNMGLSNTFNISLVSDQKALTEVVVTALGISRDAKAIGYAVGKVTPDEILQKSEPDVLKALQGKVAGVDIRSSQGTPGAATRIQIRGNSSFFGDNQPLIVVDGVPYSNDQITTSSQTSGGGAYGSGISNLDPNDIASMEVLKGSAAGALYGSRASNGVLLITTKSGNAKGSNKGFEITYRSSASVENVANLPTYQNLYGAGSQFNYSASNGSWGPAFSKLSEIPVWTDYKKAYPELFPGSTVPYRAYPNNVKDLFRTGSVFENSISFNGGNEKTAFSMTASDLTQKGYVDYSEYNRSNISMGGSTKFDMGLNVRGNLSYTRSTQLGGLFGENQVDGAASQFARSLFLARNWDLNLPFEDKLGNNLTPLGGGQFDNPRWSAKYNQANTAEERMIANMHADMALASWARVDFTLGSNVNYLNRREVTEISSRAAEGLGRLVTDQYRKQEIESNLFFTFSPKIASDFSLKTIAGFSYNQRSTERQANTGNKFIARGTHSLRNTAQQIFNIDSESRRRLLGLYGEASFGYKGWAYVTATGRNDWSSTLPVSNRSYFYPGISGSLIFTDALKMESKILDFGKIRIGYAKVGRDADPYSLENYYTLGSNFLGQSTLSLPGAAANANLLPEFTKEFEIGTQLSFFNKLVEIDFTHFNKNSTNLIAPITVASSSGYSQYYTNFGKINNKGQEVELTIRPIRARDFKWEINSSFTRVRSIVKETAPGVTKFSTQGVLTTIGPYIEAGKPFNYLNGTTSMRDDQGNLIINPATGGMIENVDQSMIGDPNPDYKLGVTNNFSYKGLTLGILFDMTKGGDIYSTTISTLLGRGVTRDTEDREGSWVIPGVYGDPITGKPILDGSGNKIQNQTRLTQNDLWFSPNATLGQTFAINTATEWNVYDATVYRLREVTLAYNIPKALFKRAPIGSIVVSLSGRNLWHYAPNVPKYTNFDPEVNSYGAGSTQGIELSAAPTVRRYGFNLMVTF